MALWRSASHARGARIVSEQALLSLGNFTYSWFAVRYFDSDAIASFAVTWAVSWGAFATFSEAIISPLRVKAAAGKKSAVLLRPARAARTLSLLFIVGGVASLLLDSQGVALVLAGVGLLFGAGGFYLMRAWDDARGRKAGAVRRIVFYFLASLSIGLLAASTAKPSVLVGAAATCMFVASATGRAQCRRDAFFGDFKELVMATRRGSGFAASTALRVLLFSVGLIALIRSALGPEATALYAAALVVVAPVQIASSTLPWITLPQLARKSTKGDFHKEAIRLLGAYGAITVVGLASISIVWPTWITLALGTSRIAELISEARVEIAVIIAGVLITSWSSSVCQALIHPKLQVASVVCGGVAAMAAVLIWRDPLVAAGLPYWVTFTVVLAFLFVRRLVSNEETLQ